MGKTLICLFMAIAIACSVFFKVGEMRTAAGLEDSKREIILLKKEKEALWASGNALEALADRCLSREKAARADADAWRQILMEMETREMTLSEKKEVPDEKTRRALFNSLDEPL